MYQEIVTVESPDVEGRFRPWHAFIAVVAFSGMTAGGLWLTPALRDVLATDFLHGTGPLPLCTLLAFLFLPTPLASAQAGRATVRVIGEAIALGVGVTLASFFLGCADLIHRNDALFWVLAWSAVAAVAVRLWLGPALRRWWTRRSLSRDPRAVVLLNRYEAFSGHGIPPGLPGFLERDRAVGRTGVNVYRVLGTIHRGLHGSPAVPAWRDLQDFRDALLGRCRLLDEAVRVFRSPDLAECAESCLRAFAAYSELFVLRRWNSLVEQAWELHPGDVWFQDFASVHLLLLQAEMHDSSGSDTRRLVRRVDGTARWVVQALSAVSEERDPAIQLLASTLPLQVSDPRGLDVFERAQAYIARFGDGPTYSGNLAIAISAERLWQRGYLHWALQVLRAIEEGDLLSEHALYLRFQIYQELQSHNEQLSDAERKQLQAITVECAAQGGVPELEWRGNGTE